MALVSAGIHLLSVKAVREESLLKYMCARLPLLSMLYQSCTVLSKTDIEQGMGRFERQQQHYKLC